MYIVLFIVILFLLGIVFSKISINIEKIELNSKKIKIKIIIKLLWFGFLPIFAFTFNENGIKILWKNIDYKKINISKISKNDFKKANIKKIKNLKIKTNLAKFTLRIGAYDIFTTTFIIAVISSIVANIFKTTAINCKKMNYVILPEFNKNEVYFEGKIKLSFNLLNLFFLFLL